MKWLIPIIVFKAGLLVSPEPYLATTELDPQHFLESQELVPYGEMTVGVGLFDEVLNLEVNSAAYFGMTSGYGVWTVPAAPAAPYWDTQYSLPVAFVASTHVYVDAGPVTAGWRYNLNKDSDFSYAVGTRYGSKHEAYVQIDIGEILEKEMW